ncbi:MAG: DUF1934 domain-containing protein [Lachnospiraceae bacterium]|nr:DUF1934 domain-containing protein [Lachnospiraceae bacterium]
MKKEVLLAIKGLQFEADQDENKVETINFAEYYSKNDQHYVIYDEITEGFPESTKNIIKFKDHSLDLTKRGLVNVHMVFEENKKNMTNYSTPYGNILIGIDAKKVTCTEKEEQIMVDVEYALEVNYEYLADCKIQMNIRSKETGMDLQ